MRKILIVTAAVLVVGVGVAWRVFHVDDLIHIGAGYTAQQTCACLFISHRSLESCQGDLEPLARRAVAITVDESGGTVTTRSFFVSRATARYEKDFGCALAD